MWPKDNEEYDGEQMFGYGPETELPESNPEPEASPEQRLLDWLQRWPKDIVSARDIQQFGPAVIRNQQGAINTAEALVRHGWLVPVQARRRDRREWRVVRRPIMHPTVATQTQPTVAP
jgi:hypothetical protein